MFCRQSLQSIAKNAYIPQFGHVGIHLKVPVASMCFHVGTEVVQRWPRSIKPVVLINRKMDLMPTCARREATVKAEVANPSEMYKWIRACVDVDVHACACLCEACVSFILSTRGPSCTHVCMDACTYVCMYVSLLECVCVCVTQALTHLPMRTHQYILTHPHMPTTWSARISTGSQV